MPLPNPLETVTVEGTWENPVGGGPLAGTAALSAVNAVTSPAGEVLLTTEPDRKDLVDGAAQWTGVLLSDSPGISAPVLYRLRVTGADGYYEDRYLQLLTAAAVGGVIQLATVATAVAGPAAATYLLAASQGQPGGVPGPLGVDGKMPVDQIPAQGGVPDATTSTKGILQLAGDLAGTAIAPTVPGLADKAATVHTHGSTQITDFATAVDTRADARIANWVGAAPAALDTLAELAAALANDANFAATVAAALAGKVPTSRAVTAGTGLSGGGDLTADRSLAVVYGTTAGTAVEGNDVRLADSGQVYPLQEGYGFHSASIHPDNTRAGAGGWGGWHTRIWVPANKSISKVAVFVTTAAAGTATLAGFGIYADDGQTLLGATTHDNNLFLATGRREATVASLIAGQGAGRFVRVLMTANYSTSSPSVSFAQDATSDAAYNGGTGIRTAFHSALSSFPATFNPSSGAGVPGWTPNQFIPIILLG